MRNANYTSFLLGRQAVEDLKGPEAQVREALAQRIQIPLPDLPGLLNVSPSQAQQIVEGMRARGEVVVVAPEGSPSKALRRAG
jgi:hypothetical protein